MTSNAPIVLTPDRATECLSAGVAQCSLGAAIAAQSAGTGKSEADAIIATFEQSANVLANLGSILFVTTLAYEVRIWNSRAREVLHPPEGDVVGRILNDICINWNWPAIRGAIEHAESDPIRLDDVPFKNDVGEDGVLAFTVTILRDPARIPIGLVWFGAEVSERRRRELQEIKSQKLAALGRLAAELAHEMNTPLQYVVDNVHFLRRTVDAINRTYVGTKGIDETPGLQDLRYFLGEAPDVVQQALAGLEHLTRVARTLSALVLASNAPDYTKMSIRELLFDAVERVKRDDSSDIPFKLELDQHSTDKQTVHSRLLVEVFRCSMLVVMEAASVRFGGAATRSSVILIQTQHSQNEINVHITAKDLSEVSCGTEMNPDSGDSGEIGHGLAVARAAMVERLGGNLSVSSRSGEVLRVSVKIPS